MCFCVFQKRKSHACGARQRCTKLEGNLVRAGTAEASSYNACRTSRQSKTIDFIDLFQTGKCRSRHLSASGRERTDSWIHYIYVITFLASFSLSATALCHRAPNCVLRDISPPSYRAGPLAPPIFPSASSGELGGRRVSVRLFHLNVRLHISEWFWA